MRSVSSWAISQQDGVVGESITENVGWQSHKKKTCNISCIIRNDVKDKLHAKQNKPEPRMIAMV